MANLRWNHDYDCTSCGNGWTEISDHEMQGDASTMPCPFCHSADQSPTRVYDTQILDDRLRAVRQDDRTVSAMDTLHAGIPCGDETIPW